MQINVAQLLKEPLGARRKYSLSDKVAMEAGTEVSFQGEAELLRTDKGILVHSRLEGQIEVACSRCVESFSYPLHLDFQEEFFPTVDVNLGFRLAPPQDPTAFTIDQNHILDLGEAVYQYAVVALPMKPICRPDCVGIFPERGGASKSAQRPAQEPDPRWAKLATLMAEKG